MPRIGSQKETPGKMLAVKRDGNIPLTPGRDRPATKTGESWHRGRAEDW